MESELSGYPSLYDRTLFCYMRTCRGELVRAFGKHAGDATSIWPAIQSPLLPHEDNDLYRRLPCIAINEEKTVDIYELRSEDRARIAGLVLQSSTVESTQDFDSFFAHLLLTSIGNQPDTPETLSAADHKHSSSIAKALVDLCNAELLFHPSNSQWHNGGRDYLLRQISFFTSRGLPIQMALPAFPCKSSNLQKVEGRTPDRGEELALRRLYQVLGQIEAMYSPGASIYIVSDGHVFSDCSKRDSALP